MISIQAAAAPALVVVVVVSAVNCVSQCVRPAEIVVVLAQVSARISISDISDRTLFWFYLNYPVTRTAYTYSALLYANYSKEKKKQRKCNCSAYKIYCNGFTLVDNQNVSKF